MTHQEREAEGWWMCPHHGTEGVRGKDCPDCREHWGLDPQSPASFAETAYAGAPGIEDERQHLVRVIRRFAAAEPAEQREILLRRAAMADRESLRAGDDDPRIATSADNAAFKLVQHDQAMTSSLRQYVRQQYLAWRTAQS